VWHQENQRKGGKGQMGKSGKKSILVIIFEWKSPYILKFDKKGRIGKNGNLEPKAKFSVPNEDTFLSFSCFFLVSCCHLHGPLLFVILSGLFGLSLEGHLLQLTMSISKL
jgi:hypothetical protein